MKIATKAKHKEGVCFKFEDGSITDVKLEDFTHEMVVELAIHGLSQKLGDSYASAMNVTEAIQKFQITLEHLEAGDFNSKARNSTGGVLAEALQRATSKPMEDVIALLARMSEDDKKDLKTKPQIKSHLADIASEKATARAKALNKQADVDDTSLDDLF